MTTHAKDEKTGVGEDDQNQVVYPSLEIPFILLITRVMAILGWRVDPADMQGLPVDNAGNNHAFGYLVPAVCLAVVAAYALFDLRSNRQGGALVGEVH